MATIDAELFPHLIDIIFAHADRAALISLRGVSSAFLKRSDARLFEHIGIHYQEGAAHLRFVDGSRLPSLPNQNPSLGSDDAVGALPQVLRPKLQQTRAVDVYSPVIQINGILNYHIAALPLAVVRRRGPRAHLLGFTLFADTYVDSFALPSHHVMSASRWMQDAPPDLRRAIVTLSCDLDLPFGRRTEVAVPMSKKELVVIFAPTRDGRPVFGETFMLDEIQFNIWGGVNITLVIIGFTTVRRRPPSYSPSEYELDMGCDDPSNNKNSSMVLRGAPTRLEKGLEETKEKMAKAWREDNPYTKLRLLTREEWEAELREDEAGKYITA